MKHRHGFKHTKSRLFDIRIGSVMSGPKRLLSDWRISVLILLVFWAVIYMVHLSRPPLLDDVDSVHAEAGREIVLRHDWVTIYTNGIRYMEKAPLLYWSVAASYLAFGIGEWSARLPLMIGVLALVLATYVLGRYVYGEAGGLYAGLGLATSLGVYIYTRFLIPEVLMALWFTLGYYFFLRAYEEERPSRFACWGFAATCALNVLTKGLIGRLFPAGAIGLFLLLTGDLRKLLRMRIVSSLIVFLAIAAPWHILAAVRTPAQGQAPVFYGCTSLTNTSCAFWVSGCPRDSIRLRWASSGGSLWRGSSHGSHSSRRRFAMFPCVCGNFVGRAQSEGQKWISAAVRTWSFCCGRL